MNTNPILEFIHRRFPQDSNWCNGNCYFFALILNSAFDGDIYYDPIDGHFIFLWNEDAQYYDWTGIRNYTSKEMSKFVKWETYQEQDSLHYASVMKYCAT